MKSKTQWFTLSKDVYVSSHTTGRMLLYHTKNGNSFIASHPEHIRVVNEVYNPDNLGVIDMETYNNDNQDVLDFIEKTTQLGIGKVIEKTDDNKPLNFLPILCLQNDIERLIETKQESLIGDKISLYLTSVTVAINSRCGQNCSNCDMIYRQTLSCSKHYGDAEMDIETIKEIIVQSSFMNVKRLNIIGGDILLYPHWDTLLDFLKKHDFSYHLFFNFNQLQIVDDLLQLPFHKEVNITFPFDESALLELLQSAKARDDFSYNFFIENVTHYKKVNAVIGDFGLSDYKIMPLYNGKNIAFFEENVFLNEKDILAGRIEMRKIFCNQKLNSNFFGALIFLPDGTVKANINTPSIGRFPDETILQLIYTELTNNTAWRKIRAGKQCNKCIYRYLCPPVGNYEMVLGKENLCNFATQ